MNPAAANLDGHALAARYEVLRHGVVASADRRHTLHSLALLMRKGMAAWIKDVGGGRAPGTRGYHTAGFFSDVRARGH